MDQSANTESANEGRRQVTIGTAGWNIPRSASEQFPAEGSALERYSARLAAVEINSSFHRPHRLSTWAKWREVTPPDFRFAVKIPKLVTHHLKLVGCDAALDDFLAEAHTLEQKLRVLLVQLPPSLAFDGPTAAAFFSSLSARTSAAIVCEPRHTTWFEKDADDLLVAHQVSRAGTDPALRPAAAVPGGWPALAYWRLHGSPTIYRSSYADRLQDYAALLGARVAQAETWCIFDNTASSAAVPDALNLQECLRR